MKMIAINFNERFKHADNQCFIALSGSNKENIIAQLEDIIKDLKSDYGKPIQKNVSGYGYECQIITPIWNGKKY
jgi:hypothetical protein